MVFLVHRRCVCLCAGKAPFLASPHPSAPPRPTESMKAMKVVKKKPPRFGPLAIAQILLLRDKGQKYAQIAQAPLVRKQDGSRACQQAVAYVATTKTLAKRKGTWTPQAGAGAGGGRPRKVTDAKRKKIVRLMYKHRFQRVRAPWVKKKLKLKVHVRTVRRVLNEEGFFLPALVNKRRLDKATKKKRVAYAEENGECEVKHWKARGYGDAKFWHLARTASELASQESGKGRVYRKKKERKDPRFHGGKKGTYKQGRKVGLFGVLVGRCLKAAWLPGGKLNGKTFAGVVRKHFPKWLKGREAVILDGEGCMHGKAAAAALDEAEVVVEKLPPNSPDFNPLENAWARLQARLAKTDPSKLENEKAFRQRVKNALKWVNKNEAADLKKMIASMPRRLAAAKALKGARTGY